MITGYLFWSKLLAKGGRPDWIGLYIGRFFRISPLYLFMLAWSLTLIYLMSGGVLHQSVQETTIQILRWLGFGFLGYGEINGQSPAVLTFGVTWTLRYEWIFYFSLPFVAVLAASRFHLQLAILAMLVAIILPNSIPVVDHFHIAFFLCGMITASIHKRFQLPALKNLGWSALAGAVILYVLKDFSTAYNWAAVGLLGAFFFLVASGTSLFGLLRLTAAKRLGNISYSIYLLQGLVFVTVGSETPLGVYSVQGTSQLVTVLSMSVVALVLVSAMTFYLIERPGIALGRAIQNAYLRSKDRREEQSHPSGPATRM
jgi:peptidoglycan/LPS O-acetylase OafA/YrhL